MELGKWRKMEQIKKIEQGKEEKEGVGKKQNEVNSKKQNDGRGKKKREICDSP